MRSIRPLLTLLVVAVQACSPPPPAAPPPAAAAPSPGKLAVTVNGVPISETEVSLAKGAHAAGGSPEEQRRAAVEALVRDELIRQRAVALGLEAEPGYVEEVRRAEAQLLGVRRRLLTDLWHKREVEPAAEVSDAEARQYFASHEQQFRTEYHVRQIMVREEGKATAIRAELAAGAPFATVAARQFPTLPPGTTPWDLGFLGYAQLPEPWKEVVPTLKPGETSAILRGNRSRFWLVQLVATRVNANVDVEKIVPALRGSLKGSRLEEARTKAEEALRASATIVYPAPKP